MAEIPSTSDLGVASDLLIERMHSMSERGRDVHIEYQGEPFHVVFGTSGAYGCWNFRVAIGPSFKYDLLPGQHLYGQIFPLTLRGVDYAEELGNALNAYLPDDGRPQGKQGTSCRNPNHEPFYACIGSCETCRHRIATGSIIVTPVTRQHVETYVDLRVRGGIPYRVNIVV